jgi:hypothetical protein
MIKCYPMSFGVLEVGGVTNVRRRWRQLRKLITASFAVKSNTDSDGLFKTAFWIALTYLLRAMCSLSSRSNELMLGQCATIQKSVEMEIQWLGIARCGENVCTKAWQMGSFWQPHARNTDYAKLMWVVTGIRGCNGKYYCKGEKMCVYGKFLSYSASRIMPRSRAACGCLLDCV